MPLIGSTGAKRTKIGKNFETARLAVFFIRWAANTAGWARLRRGLPILLPTSTAKMQQGEKRKKERRIRKLNRRGVQKK